MREALSLYRRAIATYRAWAGVLLPLALVVFVPLGLIHSIPIHASPSNFGLIESIEVLVAAAAVLVLATTGLIGEVFYTGAVSIALTRRRDHPLRSLGVVAREINYVTLIAIDLAFGVAVAVGLVALVLPGVLLFVYAGLAAPVAEIERLRFRDAFRRSFALVRGHFWLAFWVLVPLEIATDALSDLATYATEQLLHNSLLAEWATDTATNVLLTPIFSVAAVLLTLDLIADRDGVAPRLHSAPLPG